MRNCSNCFLNLVQLPHVNLATGCAHVTQSFVNDRVTIYIAILLCGVAVLLIARNLHHAFTFMLFAVFLEEELS